MRKVTKIIVHYDDGTYEEVKNGINWTPEPNPFHKPYKSDEFPIPLNPYPFKPDDVKVPYDPNKIPKWETKNRCEKCGMTLSGVMGYVCTNYPCPCGLGGSTSLGISNGIKYPNYGRK